MKPAISAILLTMLFSAGCAQNPMTRFEYGAIRLEAGGRITQGQAVAMADYKPGIYYSPDTNSKQVLVEVKLLEVGRTDQSIMGVDWFNGSDPLIAASNITNSTPSKSPPIGLGGLVNIGIGGGSSRDGCPHGPGCTRCGSDGGGVGGGIKIPVISGSSGEESDNITSLRVTFDLDPSVNIDRSYLALTIRLGLDATGRIISQPVLLPLATLPEIKPPNPPVREATTTVTLQDNQTVLIGGLLKGESEDDVKNKTPILSDIPLLGGLFKSRGAKTVKKELLIFVTPRIILNEE
jgi:type II secretory pathway component GspD/PulD (secretin)